MDKNFSAEQLAALKEVAERARGSDALASTHTLFSLRFNPATCLELIEEVERLREEVEDLSLNIPPGRYDLV